MSDWKYTDSTQKVVFRTLDDGRVESMLAAALDPAITPLAADPPTAAEIIAALTVAVQAHLDAAAQEHGYDNIFTASLRAGFTGPFQAEGIAYAQWMDACWSHCYAVLDDVMAGNRTAPTAEELIAELPVFTLP